MLQAPVFLIMWSIPFVKVPNTNFGSTTQQPDVAHDVDRTLQIGFGAAVSGQFENFSVGSWWIGVIAAVVVFTSVFRSRLR
jgi:hypothetical protein